MIFKNSFSPRYLYPFGTKVFSLKLNRFKNEYPTRVAYFVGIDKRSKGYRLFDKTISKVFISNDIRLAEKNLSFYINFDDYNNLIYKNKISDNNLNRISDNNLIKISDNNDNNDMTIDVTDVIVNFADNINNNSNDICDKNIN